MARIGGHEHAVSTPRKFDENNPGSGVYLPVLNSMKGGNSAITHNCEVTCIACCGSKPQL